MPSEGSSIFRSGQYTSISSLCLIVSQELLTFCFEYEQQLKQSAAMTPLGGKQMLFFLATTATTTTTKKKVIALDVDTGSSPFC